MGIRGAHFWGCLYSLDTGTAWDHFFRGKEAGRKPSADELGNVSRSSRRLLQIWDQLIVNGGVLGRRFETREGSSTILQTIVPEALRKEVHADLHEGARGGHLGADKTFARLKERFYWPGHFNDVHDWCRNCGTCASRKSMMQGDVTQCDEELCILL